MGWSIKKPFGGKKSIFNQVTRVTGLGTIAAVTAQTLSLKTVASSINANSGLLSQKQLTTVGGAAQIVGAAIVGGAVIGGLGTTTASTTTATGATQATTSASYLSKLGSGLSTIGKSIASIFTTTTTAATGIYAIKNLTSGTSSGTTATTTEGSTAGGTTVNLETGTAASGSAATESAATATPATDAGSLLESKLGTQTEAPTESATGGAGEIASTSSVQKYLPYILVALFALWFFIRRKK